MQRLSRAAALSAGYAVIAVLSLGCTLVAVGVTHAEGGPEPDLEPLLSEVRSLVLKHYPKAEVHLEGRTIHFRFNTRTFWIHEPLLTGEWQDAWQEIGPQKGGIVGELELRPGKYGGQAAVPQAFDKRYFIEDVVAPYSTKLDHNLYVHLKYPKDAAEEFRTAFDRLVEGFEQHVPVPGRNSGPRRTR